MQRHTKPILQVIALATAILVSWRHGRYGKIQQNIQNFLFGAYQNSKLQPSDKYISTHHILGWNFKSCYKVNPKWQRVLLFFSLPHKRKPDGGKESCADSCVPRRANRQCMEHVSDSRIIWNMQVLTRMVHLLYAYQKRGCMTGYALIRA